MNDPGNEYTHQVVRKALELYEDKQVTMIKAACGKVWAPELPIRTDKPKCPVCFKITPLFAIAA